MSTIALGATVSFAFGAGITTFFAPCAYPLLPGYVGYYLRERPAEAKSPVTGALLGGVAASVGIVATFAVLGALTATIGQTLTQYVSTLEVGVGLTLVVLGVITLAEWSPGWRVRLPQRRATITGFAAFGGLYAIAATGCLAPVFLGLVSQALTFSVPGTIAVLGAYATGMAVMMIAATVAIAVGVDAGRARLPGVAERASQLAGVVLVIAGGAQIVLAVFVYS
ncbi:cytochrome C biosynthesis protein [Halorhabdus sp. CBA1104]|uniref:cytochrome c biogenesis CcdA family protein n=1 Tax=Halorhabdus sp. CBA1104 TaxID=1380432 RepID=UPI0012B1B22F|nr:cytochrome c biogenesis protein CcdA [Halorhabdus sp. CBA1104]QGN06667.1 cytochrome C biosynthesis protein [Halorhabdus sp. CBA1104]